MAVASITVLGTAIEIVEYDGERVLSFEQVDRAHQRPKGTAKRTFHDHRARFVAGIDFIEVGRDVIRTDLADAGISKFAATAILLTRRGYLKIVKPMDDDRAWAVQGEMIDRYFAALNAFTSPAPAVATTFESFFSIGSLIGLDRNQAALSANRATRATTGVDALALMGQTALVAPQQAPALTPTEIGRDLGGLSALKVNSLLAELGLQVGRRDAKDRGFWVATAAGEPHAVYLDTGKAHGDGTPIRQLKWATTVVPLLRELCPAAAEARS